MSWVGVGSRPPPVCQVCPTTQNKIGVSSWQVEAPTHLGNWEGHCPRWEHRHSPVEHISVHQQTCLPRSWWKGKDIHTHCLPIGHLSPTQNAHITHQQTSTPPPRTEEHVCVGSCRAFQAKVGCLPQGQCVGGIGGMFNICHAGVREIFTPPTHHPNNKITNKQTCAVKVPVGGAECFSLQKGRPKQNASEWNTT